MYKKLEMSNFRGFKEFTIDLKPITLISGKNNTGKTSILESIFLFQDYATPGVFLKLLDFRGVKEVEPTAQMLWEPLFHQMNMENPIELKLNNTYFLRLHKNQQYALSDQNKRIWNGAFNLSSANYALSCAFSRGDNRFNGEYIFGNKSINNNMVLLSREDNQVQPNDEFIQYLGPHTEPTDKTIPIWFGRIVLSRKKGKLLEMLSIIDSDIVDITSIPIGNSSVLYFTKKDNTMLPIYTIGDGMKKLLYIALAMLVNPGCILLLDEVENGLHYSLHALFWEVISILAKQLQCQIIATTHSYECIQGAVDGIKAAKLEDDFTYVRLDKNSMGVIPKTFSSDMLERALDTDWEVR